MSLSAEICPLTQNALADLLARRLARQGRTPSDCRRSAPRWSFPGTVELWIPGPDGEDYGLATSINLSTTGIGIRLDDFLEAGTHIGIAVHEPEMSFHGRAVVRHCTATERGYYLAGLEFVFD
jgi:hypothetical protein